MFIHLSFFTILLKYLFFVIYLSFLVNISSSGKTGLVFERGCCHWVWSFLSAVNTSSLGSVDKQHLIKALVPCSIIFASKLPFKNVNDFHSKLQDNHEIALWQLC
jgi:hypothetical protein